MKALKYAHDSKFEMFLKKMHMWHHLTFSEHNLGFHQINQFKARMQKNSSCHRKNMYKWQQNCVLIRHIMCTGGNFWGKKIKNAKKQQQRPLIRKRNFPTPQLSLEVCNCLNELLYSFDHFHFDTPKIKVYSKKTQLKYIPLPTSRPICHI